jgi:hypothetical protein
MGSRRSSCLHGGGKRDGILCRPTTILLPRLCQQSLMHLPQSNPIAAGSRAGDADKGVEPIRRNVERYGLLDDQVQFLPGWFRHTLPKAPIQRLALLRLDGDLYESTMDALLPLYPKLASGGFVIVDDYNLPECEKAVTDYRKKMGIDDEILAIDDVGVYWRKSG